VQLASATVVAGFVASLHPLVTVVVAEVPPERWQVELLALRPTVTHDPVVATQLNEQPVYIDTGAVVAGRGCTARHPVSSAVAVPFAGVPGPVRMQDTSNRFTVESAHMLS